MDPYHAIAHDENFYLMKNLGCVAELEVMNNTHYTVYYIPCRCPFPPIRLPRPKQCVQLEAEL